MQLIQILKRSLNKVSVFFLGYCDDIIVSIMEQYTENTAEILEKSAPLPVSSSYEQVDLQEAITA